MRGRRTLRSKQGLSIWVCLLFGDSQRGWFSCWLLGLPLPRKKGWTLNAAVPCWTRIYIERIRVYVWAKQNNSAQIMWLRLERITLSQLASVRPSLASAGRRGTRRLDVRRSPPQMAAKPPNLSQERCAC